MTSCEVILEPTLPATTIQECKLLAKESERDTRPAAHRGFGTMAVHAGSEQDPITGAVIEPISLSTTFAQRAAGDPVDEYEYSRKNNPNRSRFETAIAALKHAKYAVAFSSGSATTACILHRLGMGSHMISVSNVYGGTYRYLTRVASTHGIEVTFTDSIETQLEQLINEETKLIWIETPSNPTLTVTDIEHVSSLAHGKGLLVVVDDTFLSP